MTIGLCKNEFLSIGRLSCNEGEYYILHTSILHQDYLVIFVLFFTKNSRASHGILKSTKFETPGKDLKSLLPWSSGENFLRDNVFRFGKTIFMSLPSPPAHSQSATSEFTEVGISCAFLGQNTFSELYSRMVRRSPSISTRQNGNILLETVRWWGETARRGEPRIDIDLCLGTSTRLYISKWY